MTNRCDVFPGCDETRVALVISRLEHAGRTLLALPDKGYSPALAQRRHEYLYEFSDLVGWRPEYRVRLPTPTAQDIAQMDEAYGWLDMIEDVPTRKVLHARSLVHPLNGTYLLSFRRIAEVMQKDHKWVQRKFVLGIKIIILGLCKRPTNQYEKPHAAATRA